MIIHSYIGQAPVYHSVLKCTIYPTPDYEPPEFMEPSKPKPQIYHIRYAERSGKTYAAIVQWLKEHGPATKKIIGVGLGKSDQAIRRSIAWSPSAFVELGRANDARHSAIFGLVGQTLGDMTINCDVERFYQRIAKYLAAHGESRVPDIAKAVASTESRVSSCLSHYSAIFQNTQVGKYDFIWKLKDAAQWQ